MQRPHYDAMSSRTRSSSQNEAQYYPLRGYDGYPDSVLYQVVPAGRNFFHIREVTSGRIKGFRSDHIQACALAKNSKLCFMSLMEASFRHLDDFTAPPTRNNCHTGPSTEVCPSGPGFTSAVISKGRHT